MRGSFLARHDIQKKMREVRIRQMEEKLSFVSDYMEGAHPAILKRLLETNRQKTEGGCREADGLFIVWCRGHPPVRGVRRARFFSVTYFPALTQKGVRRQIFHVLAGIRP